MPRALNTGNHQTLGHTCGQITTCVTPSNTKVFSMGEEILVANDVFVPHSYCGVDGTHVGVLLPTVPNVTVGGKPIGTELGFTSCGDLVLCVGAGKVFVNDPIASRRSQGGGAADPNEEVTLDGYPEVFYQQPAGIIATYNKTLKPLNDPEFNFVSSVVQTGTRVTNAYTEIKVTNQQGDTRKVLNYPGPPLTQFAGAASPLPSYARILEQPIKPVFRALPTIELLKVTGRSFHTFASNIENTLTVNEDTGEISNFESLNDILFPRRIIDSSLKLPYTAFRVSIYTGFDFFGTKFFPSPRERPNIRLVIFNVEARSN